MSAELPTRAASWTEECFRRERWEGLAFASLPAVLNPPWVLFDYVLEPQAWKLYVIWRALNEVVCIVAGVALYRAKTLRAVRRWGFVAVAGTCLTIAMLLPQSVHFYWAYVLGYSLIIWGTGALLSGSPRHRIALLGSSVVGFVFAHAVMPHGLDVSTMVGAGFYVVTAATVCMASSTVRYRLQLSSFRSGWTLNRRNVELSEALQRVAVTETQLRQATRDLEEQVAERTAELATSLAELERENLERLGAESRAQAANRAKSVFLANMSHELRTPLNAILGYTELVQEDLAGTEQAHLNDDLERVSVSGRHLLGIIDDLLDLSRIESGHLECRPEVFDLHQLLENAVELIRPQAGAAGNTIVVDLEPADVAVSADPLRLRQVVVNLLSNAVKFTSQGQIRISSRVDGSEAEVAIADDGIGIPAGKLERVFERFQQVDDAPTRRYGGTGLGLSICRELMEAMDGSIAVESDVGAGSTFRVRVPLGDRLSREACGSSSSSAVRDP